MTPKTRAERVKMRDLVSREEENKVKTLNKYEVIGESDQRVSLWIFVTAVLVTLAYL